jgi:xylose isomerase
MAGTFRFTFGPWNIHEGADPFGPAVRDSVEFSRKLGLYKSLGFDGVQFHDDDAVPGMNDKSPAKIVAEAKALKSVLQAHGLVAEFVAPRLWEDARTIDGAFTSNDPACRAYARERFKRCIDIADAVGTQLIVLWLAREGTYIREAKDSAWAVEQIVDTLNEMLTYHPAMRIAIEPKPNEPMDQTYIPTTGHALALAQRTVAPERIGVNIESAHAILAGLDPSDEMGFALSFGKLWSVHLNDQNGLKFDQDKAFGSVDLRRAFNQVRILDRHDYGKGGEFVGLDVKAMRTQKNAVATKHLSNSRILFLRLLEISRHLDEARVQALIGERDYEELDLLIMQTLVGR